MHARALLFAILFLMSGCVDTGGGDPSDTMQDEGDHRVQDGADAPGDGAEDQSGDARPSDTPLSDVLDTADVCAPQCGMSSCGDNGCGGSCGTCGQGTSCDNGSCIPDACSGSCQVDCEQGCFDVGECVDDAWTLMTRGNVYTAGLYVSGTSAESAEVYYRMGDTSTWWRGHDAVGIPDGRLVGSLFGLRPETTYEVMLRGADGVACGEVTTVPVVPPCETSHTVYVDAAATATGDGTQQAPFQTIQEAVDLEQGVEVRVVAGTYHESIAIGPRSGTCMKIVGGPGAILDGADPEVLQNGLSWQSDGTNVYSAPWDGSPGYVSRDEARSYHYLSMEGLLSGIGDDGESIAEGWFVDQGRIHVRCLDAPSSHTWQIPQLGTAFALDDTSGVWIEGFTIRNYGEGSYPKGIDIRNAHDVVVRNNHIYGTPSPVWVRRGSTNARIEGNTIHQSSVPSWPWAAVKGTDHENSAINVAGGAGAIVADNTIYDIFNGIGTGSFGDDQNPDIAFDVDVYRNRMRDVTDDGLEPEGACINNRFWGNTVDRVHNGVSLAPITWGPVWVLRNRFTHYTQSGFKVSNDSSGPVFLYHNTCWTDLPDHNGMNVSGYFEGMTFRNNIIRGNRYAIEMSRSAGPNDLDYDNLFTSRGTLVLKWDNTQYDTVADLCAATGLECHAQVEAPGLVDAAGYAFSLDAGSANIDAGIRLYGINDGFAGDSPDIGYLERGATEVPALVP